MNKTVAELVQELHAEEEALRARIKEIRSTLRSIRNQMARDGKEGPAMKAIFGTAEERRRGRGAMTMVVDLIRRKGPTDRETLFDYVKKSLPDKSRNSFFASLSAYHRSGKLKRTPDRKVWMLP